MDGFKLPSGRVIQAETLVINVDGYVCRVVSWEFGLISDPQWHSIEAWPRGTRAFVYAYVK